MLHVIMEAIAASLLTKLRKLLYFRYQVTLEFGKMHDEIKTVSHH